MAANFQAEDLADLQRQAADLAARAEALTQAYRRATWVRFVGVFFPIPFIVVLLRLEIAAWTYYVWGGLIVAVGAILYMIDTAASAKADAAVEAAEEARTAYEQTRSAPRPATPR
jgi:hypothetical protein